MSQKTDARLGRIVRLLSDNATVIVSGTKIADEIGTTRSEIWRLIQQLRQLGVDVAGHPATGYQLRTVPDLLLPDVIAPLIKHTIFAKHIQHYYKIDSTNTAAMNAASAGAPEGAVFLAEEQTAGRGRGANRWTSARSTGIYCSAFFAVLPPADVLVLSLAVGLAVRAAVTEINPGLNPDLKWPNDLLLNDKKFCGILTEMNAEPTRVRHLVVGVGINVNQKDFPADLRDRTTSLQLATVTEWSRVELAAALLKSLDREYRALHDGPSARESILKRFAQQSSWVRDHAVEVLDFEEQESSRFEGTTDGLDDRGFLRVRTSTGLRTVFSGTVRSR